MNEKQMKVEQYRRLNKYVLPHQILFVGSSLMEQFPNLCTVVDGRSAERCQRRISAAGD